MLTDQFDIVIADPRLDDVRQLVEHHLKFGRLHSPAQDAHALEVDDLLDPAVTLFSIRYGGELVAIGALKRLDDQHAELKTMHTVEHFRGQGVGRDARPSPHCRPQTWFPTCEPGDMLWQT